MHELSPHAAKIAAAAQTSHSHSVFPNSEIKEVAEVVRESSLRTYLL